MTEEGKHQSKKEEHHAEGKGKPQEKKEAQASAPAHHTHRKKTKFKINTPVVLIIVGILLLAVVQAQIISLNSKVNELTGGPTAETDESEAPPGAPTLDFYVMSYCPYGNQAEEGIASVYEALKGKANFNPHYVIYSDYRGGGPDYCIDPQSKYCSMHGAQEMSQDIRELCVDKYLGTDAYFDFALAMNEQCTAQNADTCWEGVAQNLGLDVERIKQCEKEEALELAEKELQLNQQLGVTGSPTVFINGEKYSGGRAPGDFLSALCEEFTTSPPECDTQLESSGSQPQGQC